MRQSPISNYNKLLNICIHLRIYGALNLYSHKSIHHSNASRTGREHLTGHRPKNSLEWADSSLWNSPLGACLSRPMSDSKTLFKGNHLHAYNRIDTVFLSLIFVLHVAVHLALALCIQGQLLIQYHLPTCVATAMLLLILKDYYLSK